MKQISKQNNFVYLFFSLVLFLFSSAVIVDFPGGVGDDVFSVVTILMIIVSLRSLKAERTWTKTVYALVAFLIFLTVLGKFFDHRFLAYPILLTLLIFFVGSFTSSVKQVLTVGDIDGNKIIGSLSLYLLLGLIWAVIYLLLMTIDPHSFSGLEVANWQQGFSRMVYYSFVTLTTLGYGDILPSTHVAEFFVYMEAIIGVFYMAIIVSSLISLRLSVMQDKRRDERQGK
ncbi:MAG: potassium channel family protein [Sulfurovum sp.]|nr:potassium channel family protein [Sulfurovum sp.]